LPAATSRNAEPTPWLAPGALDDGVFPAGIQVTDVTHEAALVSAWTGEAELSLRVVVAEADRWVDWTTLAELRPGKGKLRMDLTGLSADTAYSLALYTSNGRRSQVTRFRTAIGPDAETVVRFGASSCMNEDNAPWPSLSRAGEARLDFFVLLGDTVYADSSRNLDEYRRAWRDNLAVKGLRDLFASTSIVSTWDDHEVYNSWTWDDPGIEPRFDAAVQAYAEALPWRQGPGGTGLWRRLRWGRTVELFVLDSRGEKRGENYLSIEQMEWLKDGLVSSEARFKIIINSVPITNVSALVGNFMLSERWQGYPEQRREILGHIEDEQIEGVLWLAGDFHYGQVGLVEPPSEGHAPIWEILAGPAGSRLNPIPMIFEPDEQFRHFVGEWNYVEFEADPSTGRLSFSYIGDDGQVLVTDSLDL
jgi:alkaline phosphatase D